jgi:hypothetical protein
MPSMVIRPRGIRYGPGFYTSGVGKHLPGHFTMRSPVAAGKGALAIIKRAE